MHAINGAPKQQGVAIPVYRGNPSIAQGQTMETRLFPHRWRRFCGECGGGYATRNVRAGFLESDTLCAGELYARGTKLFDGREPGRTASGRGI